MNKKFLMFGIMGLFALALVSATLVQYYAQKEINMSVESPITFSGELTESVSLIAGNGYKLYLLEGENKLNRPINLNVRINLLDGEGLPLSNTDGFYTAYSEDIAYAYDESYGNVNTWETAKTWMFNNLDWFDWTLTDTLSLYDSSVITNHNEDSAVTGLVYNTNIPMTVSEGKFYAVFYVDVDEATEPG